VESLLRKQAFNCTVYTCSEYCNSPCTSCVNCSILIFLNLQTLFDRDAESTNSVVIPNKCNNSPSHSSISNVPYQTSSFHFALHQHPASPFQSSGFTIMVKTCGPGATIPGCQYLSEEYQALRKITNILAWLGLKVVSAKRPRHDGVNAL
jgi:hypothetical protein